MTAMDALLRLWHEVDSWIDLGEDGWTCPTIVEHVVPLLSREEMLELELVDKSRIGMTRRIGVLLSEYMLVGGDFTVSKKHAKRKNSYVYQIEKRPK